MSDPIRPLLSDPFAHTLASRRAELNARFAEARHVRPALSPDAFGAFLRDAVDPVVCAVYDAAPDRVDDVALAAYDVALDLVGQGLVDGAARGAAIRDMWRTAIPAVARIVAIDPPRVLAALTNAAHQIAATPDARVDGWIGDLARLGGQCATPDDLLRLGQVAAWRAGLAHYRGGALDAARALPEPIALAAVGAPHSARWSDVAERLAASEWFDPARPPEASPTVPRVAAHVGAFRALGGLFVEPPLVALVDGHLCTSSGGESWLVTADLFGATFHRVPAESGRATPTPLPPNVRLTRGGRVVVSGGALDLPSAGEVTSAAATRTTLAVTWSLSHHVTLVTLVALA